jgi:hypothetical protein
MAGSLREALWSARSSATAFVANRVEFVFSRCVAKMAAAEAAAFESAPR